MNKLVTSSIYAFLFFFTFFCQAQKLKSEPISYSYNRLPSLPIKGVNNYHIDIEAAYEAKNQQALKEYDQQKIDAEAKYRKDLADYGIMVKAANDRYDKEIAEYNKKSLGTKIVEKGLLDNKKPVKEVVDKPELTAATPPKLQSTYDYKLLADTYIQLEGYQKSSTDALKVVVLLYGFDHTQPRTVDETQDNVKLGGSGGSGTYKSINYHTEFSYRHPMALKVYAPGGKELMSLTPPELNSYKIYKSSATSQPAKINSELLIKTTEEKVLQDNLRFINGLLNDRFGFSTVKRTATLYFIKDGSNEYEDLTMAFNESSSGLLLLQQDVNTAKIRLQKACDLWNNALKESNMSNKKSRINRNITLGIYFNLLETYYALANVSEGQNILDKINGISMSNSDRRVKLDFDLIFAELKNRQQNN